jgi:hypothetical protein
MAIIELLDKPHTPLLAAYLHTSAHWRTHHSHQYGTIVLRHARVARINAQALETVEGLGAGEASIGASFGNDYRGVIE